MGVARESYHGGAFNGNNSHKFLKKRNEIIAGLSIFKSRECHGGSTPRSGDTTAVDTQWLDTMKSLLDKLAAIVELATAYRPLCPHEVLLLKQRCIDFGQWFPGKVAKDLTYKGHRVAKHLWQYAEYWGRRGYSPGLHTEQFGEAIHQVVKKAAGDWRKRKKSEQLRGIFMQVQRATRVERECERERRQKNSSLDQNRDEFKTVTWC